VRAGVRITPQRLLDLLLRVGPDGDRFGLRRGGLSVAALRAQPHGVKLADHLPTGVLRSKVRHRDRRVHLAPAEIVAEVERLAADGAQSAELPLRLIGQRELRSHNSWMHNSPKLMSARPEHALRIHPDDAAARGLSDGQAARLRSRAGEVVVPVRLTDELIRGAVAMPHGWGHAGGWLLANAHAGTNVNLLASSSASDLEPLAGMSHLNGIPVEVSAADPVEPSATSAAV
jgi:formate dehydrogenase